MNNAEVLIKFKGDTTDVDKAMGNATTSLTKLTKAFTIGNLAAKGISKGIEVFSSNLDGAISRVDTMNNFPKVMSNLGISAEESAEVIDDLGKKLQGLPTSLDSAATSIQRFTSKNGDVKESEKLFLAVNNAILAGGAPAQNQAAALEQISQAYAKGKPDMMEWRTLMTAMPAQLKQVATAMGYVDADALGQALRDGSLSMDDFMNTMVKMNTEGVNGFKSFDEQARNATGGIQTSITNMKTALVRGIADIINQVDKALEPFGGLSGVINSIGKIGEKAFKGLGEVLSVVIPKLIELGKWILKNKSWIIPLTGAFATFVATFITIKKVISIIKSVQAAVLLLTETLMAWPFTFIIAGIAALVVGLVLLYNKCEWFRNFVNGTISKLVKDIRTVINNIKVYITSLINGIKWAITFIVNVIKTEIDIIKGIITTTIAVFKTVFITIPTWIYNTIIRPIANFFSGMWNGFLNGGKAAWNGIKSVFSTVATFFKNIFTNAWTAVKNVFSTGGKIFTGIKEGIVSAFKTVVNGIIGGINKVVSIPFNGINAVLKKIKNINILGKKPFKGIINTISVPKIPKLATGTNEVPQDMLAMIHKGEAVVPKKFNPYANGINASMLGTMNNSHSKQVINVYANFKQDNLGQMVRDIKTFSGGARNDYNYGM